MKPELVFPKLHRALRYSVKKHKRMDRDGDHPLPYACHPIEVLTSVRQIAGVVDEDVLCAAVMHDLIEDTDVTLPDIEKKFGLRVRTLVAEVTRRTHSDDEVKGLSPEAVWELRNKELIEEIGRMSPEARTIKLADRLSNIRDAQRTRTGPKLVRYVRQTRDILNAIPRETCPSLWDQIEACIHEPA